MKKDSSAGRGTFMGGVEVQIDSTLKQIACARAEIASLQGHTDPRSLEIRDSFVRRIAFLDDRVNLLTRSHTSTRNGDSLTHATAQRPHDAPKTAEFLLTALLSRTRAHAVTGGLNERFTIECQKLGRSRAVRLYWARTLRSLWPLLRRAIGKALRWGTVIAAVRRLF